ncbi:hypothetical protein KUTeg_014441 [Tegillarca granosa]|uniref:DDB1- and CUL4-associated factor 5 n=1 Tax=Tegillarca granosa TaxID=220873 RepID=A0ABQ9F111_TEGGR|nr:hypothetical protein KUTeg_014441 [Tegillarca granosa]
MASFVCTKRHRRGLYGPISFLSEREHQPSSWQKNLLMRDRVATVKSLHRRDLKAHYGCVNAIEFSHGGGELMASGGDDRRVLLWNMEKALSDIGSPFIMKGEHNSNIFCLAFDNENRKVFSGGNDEQVSVHDVATGETLDVFLHEDAVYGLSVDPNNSNAFASACDDGRILIYDIREPPSTDPFCLANYMSSMHAVMYNPIEPRLLATANAKEGIGLWDIRKPRSCLLRYGSGLVQQSCMNVRINANGDRILALRRRLPPVLYSIDSIQPLCEFDHNGYYNSCTMKRQYVNDAHMVLKGHRSIVNQVRFNPANHLLLSSGVEKIIKVWSPFPMKGSESELIEKTRDHVSERPIFTHEEYINLVLRSGHVMTHDYSHQSTNEDPRMLAFFDSLVQRELEGWSSDDNLSTEEEELFERIVQFSRSDLSEDSSEESDTGNTINTTETSNNYESATDNSSIFSPFTIAFASVMAAQAVESTDNTGTTNSMNESEQRCNESQQSTNTTRPSASEPDSVDRRSISDLISQKRKEMKKQAMENKRSKKKRKRPTALSSSESSDEEVSRKVDKKSCTTSSENASVDGNNFAEQKQKVQIKLKKLKQLRNNILNSDSESSDIDIDKKLKPKLNFTSAGNHSNSKGSEKNKLEESSSSCRYADNQEMGPYLHEADNNQCCKKNHSDHGDYHNHHSNRPNKSEFQNDKQKNIENILKDTVSSKNNQHCNNVDENCAGTDNSHFRHLAENNPKPSTSSENLMDLEDHNSDNSDSQPSWMEFKRFKRRVERSKRHYRHKKL